MKIFKIAQSKIEVPPEMGTIPIPSGNVRLFLLRRLLFRLISSLDLR